MATLGPVSRDETVLRGLVRAGVDLFRLNLSHGTQEQHRETLRRVRKVDIQARKDTGLSPMPEGLHAGLTPQQFADLVSYLESLKSADAPPPPRPPAQ